MICDIKTPQEVLEYIESTNGSVQQTREIIELIREQIKSTGKSHIRLDSLFQETIEILKELGYTVIDTSKHYSDNEIGEKLKQVRPTPPWLVQVDDRGGQPSSYKYNFLTSNENMRIFQKNWNHAVDQVKGCIESLMKSKLAGDTENEIKVSKPFSYTAEVIELAGWNAIVDGDAVWIGFPDESKSSRIDDPEAAWNKRKFRRLDS